VSAPAELQRAFAAATGRRACAACKGAGQLPGRSACTACLPAATITAIALASGLDVPPAARCRRCDGTGEVTRERAHQDSIECRACDGTGTVGEPPLAVGSCDDVAIVLEHALATLPAAHGDVQVGWLQSVIRSTVADLRALHAIDVEAAKYRAADVEPADELDRLGVERRAAELARDTYAATVAAEQRMRAQDAETIASLRAGMQQQTLLIECADKARDAERRMHAQTRAQLDAVSAAHGPLVVESLRLQTENRELAAQNRNLALQLTLRSTRGVA